MPGWTGGIPSRPSAAVRHKTASVSPSSKKHPEDICHLLTGTWSDPIQRSCIRSAEALSDSSTRAEPSGARLNLANSGKVPSGCSLSGHCLPLAGSTRRNRSVWPRLSTTNPCGPSRQSTKASPGPTTSMRRSGPPASGCQRSSRLNLGW